MIPFIDLFAGAGGLSLGFEEVGFTAVHAVEEDKWAAETFAHNKPHCNVVNRDIRKISDSEIEAFADPGVELIVGGPPCQGFSHANTGQTDPKDPRNSLFTEFVRFAAILRPKLCVVENVPGLLRTKMADGSFAISAIQDAFQKIGYCVDYRVLAAQDFGVPQKRQRLFVIAIRDDLNGVKFRWPTPTHGTADEAQLTFFPEKPKILGQAVTLWDAISDLPPIMAGEDIPEEIYEHEPQNAFQLKMRERRIAKLENHEPMRHTARIIERFKSIRIGQSEADVPVHLRPRKRGSAGEISGSTYDQNSRRQDPDTPCNAIVASAHTNFIHPTLNRNFTVREMARIQSFPDWFIVKGKRAVLSRSLSLRKGLTDDIYLDQRAQIGNAVPPILAQAIANSCIEFLLSCGECIRNAS